MRFSGESAAIDSVRIVEANRRPTYDPEISFDVLMSELQTGLCKLAGLVALEADLYVIQECEDPTTEREHRVRARRHSSYIATSKSSTH